MSVAEQRYETLVQKLGSLGSGQPLSMRRGLEANYSSAYQQLVRLGLRPQIRAKYRG